MSITGPEILLVDNGEIDVRLMCIVFARVGYVPPLRVVCDGAEAIAYLQGDGAFGDRRLHPLPVVMLLDLNMPRKNGFDVLAWVRAHPAHRPPQIYVLSASSYPDDIRRCRDLGADAYLVKPRNLDGLKHLAGTLLAWIRLVHFAGPGGTSADLGAAPAQ